jgi:tetratricopeptide (TPR) repeat protein
MNKLEQAMEDHKNGKWKEADSVYEEILTEEPENAEVMYILATSQMSQNKLEEALKTINKAIEVNDNAPSFLQLKGAVLARLGQTEKALKTLEKAIKQNPNLYQAHIAIGYIYYTKADKKNAEKHYRMAIKIDGKKPEGHVNLANILIDEGKIEEAVNLLRTIEKEHPEQASIKMIMGQAFIENGAYNFAENYFQKVLAMHPEYQLAGLYLGIAKLNTGDEKNAEKLITAFNQQYPNTREGIAALGLLMYYAKRFRMAVEYLRKAIGEGLAPFSWRTAFIESLAHLRQYQPAINFYEENELKFGKETSTFRLAELYEITGNIKKAKKSYKKITKDKNKFVSAQLGLGRCYLIENSPEKTEKICKVIFTINDKHAEATLLYITSLLKQNNQKQALKVLEKIDYSNYNNVYKKTFRLQHGLVLNQKNKYSKAMNVFEDNLKKEEVHVTKLNKISEDDIKKALSFKSVIDDSKRDPIFIIGSFSTLLDKFVTWLYEKGVKVLNDRLISKGRPDILYMSQEIDKLVNVDDDMVRLERKIYHQKAKTLMMAVEEENPLITDCLFINPEQMILVKKFFPNAKVLMLTRDTPDIWLHQKVFGEEPVDSKDWNEAKNQILSLGLNLYQIDADKWLDNDEQTLIELSNIFEKELQEVKQEGIDYWRRTSFAKSHWKKYKDFLGQ